MKKLTTLMFLLCLGYGLSAQVKISGTGSTTAANASSVLELEATDKGLLIPRVSSLSNIVSPAEGLLVYQTSDSKVYIRKSTAWEVVGGGVSAPVSTTVKIDSANGKASNLTVLDSMKVGGMTIGHGKGNISSNIAFGKNTLRSITTGNQNIAIGTKALFVNQSGNVNLAIGDSSLYGNILGNKNISIGKYSLYSNTGSNNIGIGFSSLSYLGSGDNNIAIGIETGYNFIGGNNNILLGNSINFPSSDNVQNQLLIGNAIYGTNVYTAASAKIGIGTTTLNNNATLTVLGSIAANGSILTSDRRFKKNIRSLEPGLSAVLQLKPAAYNWDTSNERMASANPNQLQYGFIAQELETVLPDLVSGDGSTQDYKSVNYIELIPILTKAIQELSEKVRVLESK